MATGFIDIPFETDASALEADALDAFAAFIPGWVPREGHIEVWLIEVMARMAAEAAFVAAKVPQAIFRTFGKTLIGLLPIDAAPAEVSSTWVMADAAGYTVPAGTVVAFRAAGDVLIPFVTVNDVIVSAGSTTTLAGSVLLRAVESGTVGNGYTGAMTLVDSLAFVSSVTATTTSSGGVDAETDGEYVDRLAQDLKLLTPRPILAGDFATLARNVAGVYRALAVDNYIPSQVRTLGITNASNVLVSPIPYFSPADIGRTVTGTGIAGGTTITSYTDSTHVVMSATATATNAAASITLGALSNVERAVAVALVDEAGAAVSPTVKQAVSDYLEAMREVNFVVRAMDPTYTNIDVVTTFVKDPSYETVALQTSVQQAILDYLDPGNWAGGDLTPPEWRQNTNKVRYLELAALINSVPGVDYVASLTINAGTADVTMSGSAPLPDPGTVTATVV